ncbi:MAG: flagellar biosynthetic protein FliR [Acidobacteriia bacterium]|nr:flagellar biosynthetic protein FliR [Terriglobia bacterium]
MPASFTLPFGTLYAFLLVLARVGGAFVFVPLPGAAGTPGVARTTLAVGFTLALASRWPAVDSTSITAGRLIGWVLAEAAVGLAIGVAISIIVETFQVAAQILGLQAGYSYASTVDPNTQADSGILLVIAQLTAGLLFFATGLDRDTIRLFAESLDRIPPGTYAFGISTAELLIHLMSNLFSIGLRLALPVVALLVMVDFCLALLGRVNSQLQLLSLAFPAKMLVALMVLSWVVRLFPRISHEIGGLALGAAHQALGL